MANWRGGRRTGHLNRALGSRHLPDSIHASGGGDAQAGAELLREGEVGFFSLTPPSACLSVASIALRMKLGVYFSELAVLAILLDSMWCSTLFWETAMHSFYPMYGPQDLCMCCFYILTLCSFPSLLPDLCLSILGLSPNVTSLVKT